MKNYIVKNIGVLMLSVVMLGGITATVSAQRAQRASRVSDKQVQKLLVQIERHTGSFTRSLDTAMDDSPLNGSIYEDQVNSYVGDFKNAADNLMNRFNSRSEVLSDVQNVLNRAANIDTFMRQNTLNYAAKQDWNLIRTDLNTLANYYRVSWNWNTTTNPQTRPYYVTDNKVKSLLVRIEQRSDIFRRDVDRWFDRSRLNGTQTEDTFNDNVAQFENATDGLRRNFNERNSVTADVEQVLSKSLAINRFVKTNSLSSSLERQWSLLRGDLSTLGNYYRVSWNWNSPNYPTDQNTGFDSRLTGSYRLNVGQSDNVSKTIEQAISNIDYNENQRARTQLNLERRLTSPELMTFEKRGQQVTMASSTMSQITFNADGVTRSETSDNGRTVNVRAASTDSELTISYEGDRMNDYYVSFSPMVNGQLRITRRIYLENRNETVTATSIYDKTYQNARWDTSNYPNTTVNNNKGFVVPNNTRMLATLDTTLSTRTVSDADRFSMTVNSPSQYQGAIIEGRVIGDKSGVISGRATLSLSFDTIRLLSGNTYRFAGIVEQVRLPNGTVVSVNNEGTVQDKNQTTKTVTRAGIGAAIGAIIGAIADGGKGAIIGAGIGAGAGAGTVILQGRGNLELPIGSEFTFTATAPSTVANNQ